MTEAHLMALTAAKGIKPTASNISRLGKEFGIEAGLWAISQLKLREKALKKFELAEEMFFVGQALEQSSHEEVARYHGSLFPEGVLVADLTCSIGSDLIALAKRGQATGFDLDAERIWCAKKNLEVHGLDSQVLAADSMEIEWDFEYAFVDPARRVGSRRTLSIEEFQPNPPLIASRFNNLKLGVMKLTPMLQDDILESLGSRIEFVSHHGECKEALVFGGTEVGEPGKWAVHIESGERLGVAPVGSTVDSPLEFIFDPDPALIRVHGLGNLGASGLGSSSYLTAADIGDSIKHKAWRKAYQVLHSGVFDVGEIKRRLKDLGCSQPELKQSGANLDLIQLQKKLKQPGQEIFNVLFYKVGKSLRYAIAKKINE